MRKLATFTLLMAGGLWLSGCCALQKQPGRCAGCLYDNCVIPVAAGNLSEKPLLPKVPSKKAVPAMGSPGPMAY